MTRSYTHSRPYPAWNRVQLEAGVASGAALVNCRRTITALLECGDLSPLWPWRQNESGDKSPHSISDSSFVGLLHASRGRNWTPASNCTRLHVPRFTLWIMMRIFGWLHLSVNRGQLAKDEQRWPQQERGI